LPPAEVLVTGDVVMDRNGRYIRIDGSYIDLTPSEFELLAALMTKPDYALSREELLGLLHGAGSEEGVRTFDVHIKNLRTKIEPDPGRPRYVKTVYGSGYRFAAEG
jgi:DNA-binding response OmpR family regulator